MKRYITSEKTWLQKELFSNYTSENNGQDGLAWEFANKFTKTKMHESLAVIDVIINEYHQYMEDITKEEAKSLLLEVFKKINKLNFSYLGFFEKKPGWKADNFNFILEADRKTYVFEYSTGEGHRKNHTKTNANLYKFIFDFVYCIISEVEFLECCDYNIDCFMQDYCTCESYEDFKNAQTTFYKLQENAVKVKNIFGSELVKKFIEHIRL